MVSNNNHFSIAVFPNFAEFSEIPGGVFIFASLLVYLWFYASLAMGKKVFRFSNFEIFQGQKVIFFKIEIWELKFWQHKHIRLNTLNLNGNSKKIRFVQGPKVSFWKFQGQNQGSIFLTPLWPKGKRQLMKFLITFFCYVNSMPQ